MSLVPSIIIAGYQVLYVLIIGFHDKMMGYEKMFVAVATDDVNKYNIKSNTYWKTIFFMLRFLKFAELFANRFMISLIPIDFLVFSSAIAYSFTLFTFIKFTRVLP